MKLSTPFNALKNATSDIWRMHDFNYKLPQEAKQISGIKNILIIQHVRTAKFINLNFLLS
tara:strand:- start:51 stop:230 length:180 start_codon:yes stop_codon:yes gene_type:complete